MIVIDPGRLKFLLAGRQVQIDVQREYRKGRSYAVGTSSRRSICRAHVLERREVEDGWCLTLSVDRAEKERWLAADPAGMRTDYTSDPSKRAIGEPTPLTESEHRELSKYRPAVAQNEQAAQILEIRERVMADLDEALRTRSMRQADRDRIRMARHQLKKLGA